MPRNNPAEGGKDAVAPTPHPTHSVAPAHQSRGSASPIILPTGDSAEWLRVTLSCIGDGVITTDRQGRVTFLNPVAQALTGWTHAQAVADGGVPIERLFQIVHETTRAKAANPALRALREGKTVGMTNHTILISKDGTERPIEDSAAPIRSMSGETSGAVLVFRDVAVRYAQEKLVQDAFDYASNILETQREPFLVLDKSLRVVSANRSFYKVFRVEKDATENRFVYDLGDGQWNIPKLRELLEDVLPRDHAFEGFEVEHDFPAGVGQKTMLINARRIRKPGADSELILLAIEDITERKLAKVAQLASEVRFRRLFESSKDGILILDALTGKITDVNPFMCGLTGMEASEIIGKELRDIGMFKDAEQNNEAFRELQRTGYLRHDHLPLQNRAGERVEVEFIANVYQEGDRTVAQCNVRDISAQILLQRQLAKTAEALAVQSRAKDEFLAMLSHELRNPLAPIRSAVHLLRLEEDGHGSAIQQQAREVIERQVASLTRMVSDLADVSRVLSGRIRMDIKTIDLNLVVRHALQTVAPLFEQRRHSVSVNLSAAPVWVDADPTRLEEVLVNLLTNSAKYTPDGGRIEVGSEVQMEEEAGAGCQPRHALIRVRDNGVGIDQELLPRIFDLFTQADRSLARSAGGLGIGLSLAQRLTALHGGTIAAHSQGAGKGSEFTVRLPLISDPSAIPTAAPGAPAQPSARLPARAGAGGSEANGIRVLVVDDNIDLVTMLSGVLRYKGFEVQTAHNGTDGLRIAQQWHPDIALLDIGLPGLDGYEIARKLRSDHVVLVEAQAAAWQAGGQRPADEAEVSRMKLIAITGYGRPSDIALAREAGFDGHMVKPCDFVELEKMMAEPALAIP